jgi:hypothetical protein
MKIDERFVDALDEEYERVVKPVFDLVGGKGGTMANDICFAIRGLKLNFKDVTSESVYEDVKKSARNWRIIEETGNFELFNQMVSYYVRWENLDFKSRSEIKKLRAERYLSRRENK